MNDEQRFVSSEAYERLLHTSLSLHTALPQAFGAGHVQPSSRFERRPCPIESGSRGCRFTETAPLGPWIPGGLVTRPNVKQEHFGAWPEHARGA